jgi:hypothetical protein
MYELLNHTTIRAIWTIATYAITTDVTLTADGMRIDLHLLSISGEEFAIDENICPNRVSSRKTGLYVEVPYPI